MRSNTSTNFDFMVNSSQPYNIRLNDFILSNWKAKRQELPHYYVTLSVMHCLFYFISIFPNPEEMMEINHSQLNVRLVSDFL